MRLGRIVLGVATMATLATIAIAPAAAQPDSFADACFVRGEPRPPTATTTTGTTTTTTTLLPAAAESRLGMRRKNGQLYDVELAVVGPDGALCAVSGVARLRPGDALVLPVRPESGKGATAPATPCLVSLRAASSGAIEITTTESACQAQSLCAGQVQLHGQRFEPATRLPAGGRSPCFAGTP